MVTQCAFLWRKKHHFSLNWPTKIGQFMSCNQFENDSFLKMCHNGQIMNVGGLAQEIPRKQKKVHSISSFHMMKHFIFNLRLPSFLLKTTTTTTINLYFCFLHLNIFCLFLCGSYMKSVLIQGLEYDGLFAREKWWSTRQSSLTFQMWTSLWLIF